MFKGRQCNQNMSNNKENGMLKQKVKKILVKNKTAFFIAQKINYLYRKSIENLQYLNIYLFHNKNKQLISNMKDGILRMRITNQCNAKCRYCGIQFWNKEKQNMSMDSKVLYEYCKPLYENIKIILLTGGDPLIAKESFRYCEFISEKYPEITMMLESNGIAFDEKWHNLAMKNLMKTHFSINASNNVIYQKGCWSGDSGKSAYLKSEKNIEAYLDILKKNKLGVFAPSFSMVINKDTACDLKDFIKKSLKLNAQYCMLYFDYTENDMMSDYFGCPEISRHVLKELMKIERVLAKRFFVYFRLWLPLKESESIQEEVNQISTSELQKEYSDLLTLAKSRSMEQEYKERNEIRKKNGKKEFSFFEDFTPTIHQIEHNGKKKICFAPFKEIDIYPDKMVECCGWITPRIDLNKWIINNFVNWDELFNSLQIKSIRYDMFKGCYDFCQNCCPLNPTYHECIEPHKYGYNRIGE